MRKTFAARATSSRSRGSAPGRLARVEVAHAKSFTGATRFNAASVRVHVVKQHVTVTRVPASTRFVRVTDARGRASTAIAVTVKHPR